MTERDFMYWLHGFFELFGSTVVEFRITAAQKELIRKHIELVRAMNSGPHTLVTSIEGLLTLDDPTEALRAVLKAQFTQIVGPDDDGTGIGETMKEVRRKLEESFPGGPAVWTRPDLTCSGGPKIC